MRAVESARSSNNYNGGGQRRLVIVVMVIALIVVEGLTPPTALLCGYTTVTRARVVSPTRLAYRYLGDDDNSHNYLESLNGHSPLPSSFEDDAPSSSVGVGIGGVGTNNYYYEEDEVKFRTLQSQRDTIISSQRESMLQDVRNQKSIFKEQQMHNMHDAMLRASKRTYPKDVLSKRITYGRLERKGREKERLEMRYVEKMAKLESSKVLRRNSDDEAEDSNDSELASSAMHRRRRREGIPILDILSRPPIINLPPLLVGETISIHRTDLTPFQLRALDVASSHHHVSSTDSSWCSAPLVAVIDGYTATTTELPVSSVASSSSSSSLRYKRYATLASVEIINKGDEYGSSNTSSMVKLMGVGRALLRNYFSSSGAMIPMTEEEGELSDILARIQELGNTSLDDDDDDDDQELAEEDEYEVNKEKLPVIMAEFDVFLDDSSIIYNDEQFTSLHNHQSASSRHAITNLFRAANRVYRVFDERKRLVAVLRAGASRLRHSQSDNALYYNDSARNALEQMEYYGLCSTTNGIMSTIHELTNELMLQLQPYYSQEHREREEYEAEVASMAVLKTLEVTPTELAALLLTPSATRRLELEFDIIMRHKEKLRQLVRIINEELIDCGEECTDLW